MPDLILLKELIDYVAMKGLTIVAGTLFVVICLWAFWHFVSNLIGMMAAIREWIPKWFCSQTALNDAVRVNVEAGTETMREIREAVNETKVGVIRLLQIAGKDADV